LALSARCTSRFTVCMRTEEPETTNDASQTSTVDLYWIPLGAGQHVVRLSGWLFEVISAHVQHRRPCDLYHTALVVVAPEGRFVIEQTPISDDRGTRRGVVWRDRSDRNSLDASVSSGMRSADGETASSPISPRLSRVPCG